MPPDIQNTLPGYDPDVQKNRSEARAIMRNLGYGPDNRLALKVSTRNVPPFRDPAVILIDQLKDVFIEGELEIVETALWYPKMYRKDYKIGLNLDRRRRRRPGPAILRELCLRFAAQLHRLLQSRTRKAVRSAIGSIR